MPPVGPLGAPDPPVCSLSILCDPTPLHVPAFRGRFVSKIEAGPMFPLPVRLMMKFDSMSPVVQRMMSTMMSWMMHEEDGKVKEGQVLRDINKVILAVPYRPQLMFAVAAQCVTAATASLHK